MMAMSKGIVKILLSKVILIFKHVKTANIVTICYHFAHGSTFMYASSLHRSKWLGVVLSLKRNG